jgi:hypothetical protein
MAIYHLNAKVGSRSSGQSAAAKYDYICREGRYDRDRDELVYQESALMPAWAEQDPSRYWESADLYERANGRLFQQIEFALPRELSEEQQIELAREFALTITNVPEGFLPYTLAVHRGDGENPHAHLIISERIFDGHDRTPESWFKRAGKEPEEGGARKTTAYHSKEWIEQTREVWSQLANQTLEREGREERIDHRSYAKQGIERIPTVHEGPNVRQMHERGLPGDRIALNAEIRDTNIQLSEIRTQSDLAQRQLAILQKEIENEHKQRKEREAAAAREREAARAGDIEKFIREHRKDFTTHAQGERWFENKMVALTEYNETPVTARDLFLNSALGVDRTISKGMAWAERDARFYTNKAAQLEEQIKNHRDPRSMWQRLKGEPDRQLESLHEQREAALKRVESERSTLKMIDERWKSEKPQWEAKAKQIDGNRVAQNRKQADEWLKLFDLKDGVLKELNRRDNDPEIKLQREQQRALQRSLKRDNSLGR